MPFKTITIKEEVYKKLMKAKGGEESFSDFFGRIVEKKKPDLMRFAGAWSKMSKEDFEKVEKSMKKYRKSFNRSWEDRKKRYGL